MALFEVHFEKDHFFCSGGEALSSQEILYLKSYLNQVSSYKKIGTYQNSPVLSLYQPPLATRAGERSLYFRLKRRFHLARLPSNATIAVNRACQCACEHCSAIFYNHSAKPDLSPELLNQALQESVELGVTNLILLGGEPLLRKDLCDLIHSVDREKSVVTLFTNGEYLSEAMCKRLAEAGVMGVFISLDSARAEEHDRFRKRPGLFEKALRGIENLQKSGVLTAISSCLTSSRVRAGALDEMMEMGRALSVNEVTFFDAIPSGRWLHQTEGLLQKKDREEISRRVHFYRHQSEYPGITAQSTLTSEEGSAFCFAANTQFYLTAHGEMCPCDFTPLSIGKFPEESIQDLWEKMIQTPPYDCRSNSCRMQDTAFRARYIDPLKSRTESPPFTLLQC